MPQSLLSMADAWPEDVSTVSGLRLFGGIALLLTLALSVTSLRVQRLLRLRWAAALLSGGWLAIGTGFALGRHVLHVIDGQTLLQVRPLMAIGLGWIGAIVGLQARSAYLAKAPARLWAWSIADAGLFIVIGGALTAALLGPRMSPGRDAANWLLVPAAAVAACCIGWSPETRSLHAGRSDATMLLEQLIRGGSGLCGLLAIALFGMVFNLVGRNAAGERHMAVMDAALQLAVAFALALLLGWLGRALLRIADRNRPETFVIFLGLVSLVAGIAAELALSPLFTAMLAGIVIANMGGPRLRDFERFITNAEHVVATVFFLLAGVLLKPTLDAWGCVMIVAIIAARCLAKPALMRFAIGSSIAPHPLAGPLAAAQIRQAPIALALAVALVLSEDSQLNRDLLTVIVVVGLVSDLVSRAWRRGSPRVVAAGARAPTTLPRSGVA